MGNQSSSGGAEEGSGSSVSSALSSLWSASSDKDDTCRTWGLSKKERIMGFFTCLALGLICFGLALALTPVIVVKSRKFAALFTLGSLFSMGSFSFLWGPWAHLVHLLSCERLPFTLGYLATAIGTLYCALSLHNTILTILLAAVQIMALVWFLVSYIPGGASGLKLMAKLFSRLFTSTMSSAMNAYLGRFSARAITYAACMAVNLVEGVGDEVLAGGGVFIVFTLLAVVCLFSHHIGPRRHVHPQQEDSVAATREELSQIRQRGAMGDSAEPGTCSICLSHYAFPVDTNCGHTFCAECILSYWRHDQWPRPARCAICRCQVTLLLPCAALSESVNSDLWNSVVDYNHRMSGQPRSQFVQYMYDVPVIAGHVWRLLFTAQGVVLLYRLHILLLLLLLALYLLSPLDLVPEAVFGILGLLDDIVILVAVVSYAAIIYRHHITHR